MTRLAEVLVVLPVLVRAVCLARFGSAGLRKTPTSSIGSRRACDRGGSMAAPALPGRTGSAGSLGNSLGNSPTMAAGRLPHSGAGPELDFRSAARMEDLNRLIQEFSKHDQREYDDQRALEIHTAKDFIFSMLGEDSHRRNRS